MDLAAIAHLAAIKTRVPFVHFFDGFRTSHEIQKIEEIDQEAVQALLDQDALKEFRDRALNPEHPVVRGTAQNPDIYFQARRSFNPFYDAVPGVVEEYLDKLGEITGRKYGLFDYYGAPDADRGCSHGIVDWSYPRRYWLPDRKRRKKVGLISVHLYRPFSAKHFLSVLPKTAKRVCVLDRTKEPEPVANHCTSM